MKRRKTKNKYLDNCPPKESSRTASRNSKQLASALCAAAFISSIASYNRKDGGQNDD